MVKVGEKLRFSSGPDYRVYVVTAVTGDLVTLGWEQNTSVTRTFKSTDISQFLNDGTVVKL